MSMVEEVATRAKELILIEMADRSKHNLGPIPNLRFSNEVYGALDLAYEMVRGEDDPPEIPIVTRMRARDLALGVA